MACYLCKRDESPWSICYDPEHARNVWGGDTHLIRAEFCKDCLSAALLWPFNEELLNEVPS
jgi:hypothetical protein